jgi:hypothetical protein
MTDNEPTGLLASATDGASIPVCGTSYAAPLISRTLAELDLLTDQALTPRTLRALMLHNADAPQPLTQRGLRDLARQFVGFGKPPSAIQMLETSDSKITIVFESLLTAGTQRPAIMRFGFEWPQTLTDPFTGACSGSVRITLVYEPPLDPAFGAEFARVNLDASLKQQQPVPRRDGGPSFSDQSKMWGLPATTRLPLNERALIDHGLKWWPAKRYTASLSNNGSSNIWRLEVASVTRAETAFPSDGIPFSLILSIEDPDGQRPIFQNFRRYLQTRGTQIDDIRIAHRVRQSQ